VRIAVIVVLMFAMNTLEWFSPLAFGLAAVPGTLLLLAYEARLTIRGLGSSLQIPPTRRRSERPRPWLLGGLADARSARRGPDRPPEGFEAPGTEIFDYTDTCLIGSGTSASRASRSGC